MSQVTLIDYGVGNLLSVRRGLEHCGAEVIQSADPKVILTSKKVVLPGVGAFPIAMNLLSELNLISIIQELGELETPLLGICLGMQLLMDESDEFGETAGLGLIPGRVIAVPSRTTDAQFQKIPHVGWSGLYPSGERRDWSKTLLQDNNPGDAVYFVHSFMVQPANDEDLIAHAAYGGHTIPAVISRNQITGCQFHPEKSGQVGLKILRRFIEQ